MMLNMKTLALCLLASLFIKPALAQDAGWTLLAKDGDQSLYLQSNSVKAGDNGDVLATTTMNYTAKSGNYQSMLSVHRINCQRRQSRYEMSSLHKLHFAAGALITDGVIGVDGDEWTAGGANSFTRALITKICSK